MLLFLKVFRHLDNQQQVVFQMFWSPGSQAPKLSIYLRSIGEVIFLFLRFLDLFLLFSRVLGTPEPCILNQIRLEFEGESSGQVRDTNDS